MPHLESVRGACGLLSVAHARGAGPALVFVHGNSSNRAIWRPLLEHFEGHETLALDLRGHGASQWARPPAYSTADYATDIDAAVRQRVAGPFVLVGHSNGGLAALWYAAFHERAPMALVHLDIEPSVPPSQVEYFRVRAASVSRPVASLERLAAGMRQVDPLVPDDAMLRYVAELVRPDEDGWRLALDPQTYAAWTPADLWPVLPRVNCPVTVIRARQSLVMGGQAAVAMCAALPAGRLVELPDAGHLLPIGRPDAVAAELRRVLSELVGGGV